MWPKFIQMAPIVITGGSAIALFTIHTDDPKFKKILNAIGLFLAIGTVFGLVVQLPKVMEAINNSLKRAQRFPRKSASFRPRWQKPRQTKTGLQSTLRRK